MRSFFIRLICVSMIVAIIAGTLIGTWYNFFDKKEPQESNRVIGSEYPRLLYGKVVEKIEEGKVRIEIIKSEIEIKENKDIIVEYETVTLSDVNTFINIEENDIISLRIWGSDFIEEEKEKYIITTDEIFCYFDGYSASGYIEYIDSNKNVYIKIDEAVDLVSLIYDKEGVMKKLAGKTVKVIYEEFEANWSKEGCIPEVSTPKEGLEVRILFEKESVVDDGDDIVINCERIFEIKPYDYFQTTAKEE